MRIADYIRANLPKDQYPEESNESVVMHYRAKECPFDQVLLRYHYFLVSKSVSKMPGMDGDDVYQELVMRLMHCCSKWDPNKGTTFMTYLNEGCSNHIRWILRKQLHTHTHRINYETMIRLDELLEDEDGNVFKGLEPGTVDDHGAAEILTGLKLSDREKECIKLVLEEYNNKDIGDKLGITRTRVSQILRGVGRRLERDNWSN